MILKERLKNNLGEVGKDHILYRILDAGILEVDSGWRKFCIKIQERIIHSGVLCHGLTDFDECTISFDPSMKKELAVEVVVHELFHIVLESVGMGGDEEDIISTIKNEQATTIISRGYMQLVKLNPDLFDIIQSCLDDREIEDDNESEAIDTTWDTPDTGLR
tara:strand:+ start:678 stop:1163 length:486 start_codon:yes stop_codon:yes gene_type:complete